MNENTTKTATVVAVATIPAPSLLDEGLAAAGFATAHTIAAAPAEPDPMIWGAVGQLPHVFRAAVALVCGDLPPVQREHAESALCIARAYCLLSSQGRAYAWEMIVNADLDAPAWQAPLLALELADELRHEAMVQEDDPTFTVERDAQRVHGLDGEALDAYMAAARRLRDLPPVPDADEQTPGKRHRTPVRAA